MGPTVDPTMGHQGLCLVHQLVYWDPLPELFQHSVVAPAVEADHMRMMHLPGASQNHWAVESVVPEEAVAPVSALALAEAAAHPPVAVHSHIRSPLAIRHGRNKAAAMRMGCSTYSSSPVASASCIASLPGSWEAAACLHLLIHSLVDSGFHLEQR